MPLYEFICPNGHKQDKIVPYDTQSVKCTECGKKATRDGIELPARRNPAYGIQR